ncbi:short-chain fatty acids transporter [Desulfacinum infernum DSM 9756]|jgi:short-chain fatty acids transporter|uniref:Short-chain fatty acids transporter n=1 Tax=Desulfacinum infernum DSM 9756 TaxID=1121391 RepID=A0A1M4Z3K3_9BACT|nr:TIGR00366 family protein [Desulfacinum infernum]SHF12653.1 short-chain fatty acids transporter [Desulfacinum infernum DSM 9756]
MIRKLGEIFSRWAERYIPDPFIFAILLTFLTWLLGILFTDNGPFDMILHWHKGFWNLLQFSMQMCLILVTGYALATTQVMRALIDKLADIPKSAGGAAALVALVAIIGGYINWGLGLIVGALMARQVALRGFEKKVPMHYPLLGAAGYAGLAVWHGGFSGSAPLLVATKGHFLEAEIGILPVTATLFSTLNIAVAVFLILVLPYIFKLLCPSDPARMVTIDQVLPNAREIIAEQEMGEMELRHQDTLAAKLERSVAISMVIGLGGMIAVVWYFATNGFKLNLDIVNFTFLFLGILLHKRPVHYVRAVADGTRGCAGIILQFPFYSGIMGMMKFSGLIVVMANWFIAISNQATYPLLTFVSAALVNLFVPSGGGQWAVQGPVIVKAAQALDVSLPKAVMALAYGDQWTNLLQPFWALALLGITGLKARQIMGYCIAVMLIGALFFLLALLLLPA